MLMNAIIDHTQAWHKGNSYVLDQKVNRTKLAQEQAANSKSTVRRHGAAAKTAAEARGGGGGDTGGNLPEPTATWNSPASPTLPELSVEVSESVYLRQVSM